MLTMKTKLVYILPEYYKAIGSHFYHKYEFLLRLDREVDIFLILEKGERPDGIVHVYIQKFRFVPFRFIELFCILLWMRLKGYKTFWSHYSFCGGILAPLFGKSFYWNCGMPWLYRRSRTEEFFFRQVLGRSELVTGTEGLGRMYATTYGLNEKRIHILPNWINIERYSVWRGRKKEARLELGIDEKKKVVLFLHRLSRRKGAHLIVPVAEGFRDNANILFVIVGGGSLSDIIQGSNIKLVGEIPQRDTPQYFAAADVFFMPSEEEGVPHALLEAMAVGIPFVASDIGGVRDIVPESARECVVRQDVHLFQDCIRELLRDASRRKKIGEASIMWVERFSLDNVLKKFYVLL